MNTELTTVLSMAGGLFFLWTFWHVCLDWLTQTERNAMAKSRDHAVLLAHSIGQGFGVMAPWLVLRGDVVEYGWMSLLMAMHHGLGDSYVLVWAWAKWVRRVPELEDISWDRGAGLVHLAIAARKPGNAVIFMVVDQVWHLFPLAVLSIVMAALCVS